MKKENKGLKKEKLVSLNLHEDSIALLISSISLRSRNCGQIDVARFLPRGKLIEVYEVKSSPKRGLSLKQRRRLSQSIVWLEKVFEPRVCLKVI